MDNMLCDDFGRVITLQSSQKDRIKGIDSLKANIATVNSISNFLSTSLGPNGLDKIIQSENEITITNDGRTILTKMSMEENPISRLVLQLSEAQDDEVGDGTTSVVILAGALLKRSIEMLDKGIHPVRIIEGFEAASQEAIKHLESISEEIRDKKDVLRSAAKTSLNSKIVNKALDKFVEICVDAVTSVYDYERNDLDFDLIKIESAIGTDIAQSELINGVVLKKEMSHPQMKKELRNARIAILSCPFEPPKLKNKHSMNIQSVDEYNKLAVYEKERFLKMIEVLKKVKADIVLCQWGFDDEANSLLMEHGLPAIRWVGGHEIEQIAVHTNANIIARFEDLKESDLGLANIKETKIGTEDDKIVIIENSEIKKTKTIFIRGGNDMIIEEAKRSVRDALCAVRNVLSDSRIVYGGGSCDVSTSLHLLKKSKSQIAERHECFLTFGRGLEEIPFCLAKNNGYDPVECVSEIRIKQAVEDSHYLGVGEFLKCEDMKSNGIFDSLKSKIKQYLSATELVNMILKIDDIIINNGE